MSITGVNLLATNYNAIGSKAAGLAQEGGQGASAKHGSESINNLAQKDRIEQAEEVSVNTGIKSKKPGSPTNIDGQQHAASGTGASEIGQSAGQEAVADFESRSVNNQSEIASVDQQEKISTNLDVDVLGAKGRHYHHHYGHYGRYGRYGHGRVPGRHHYKGPDSIYVNLDSHEATADLLSATTQEGAQVAKANHGSESINNLKQVASTNQAEDVSVNSDVNVHGRGTAFGGPVVVNANDHTAAGTAVATSAQSGSQTAISDNGSLSVNNMSQSNFVHQNEKVGVNTNVIV